MRIMIAGSTYAPAMNGQAVFTTNLAEGLVKLGHKVLMILDSHQLKASQTIVNGVRLEELRSVSLAYIHAEAYVSLLAGREIRRLFDDFQPEIIHIQDHYPVCWEVVRVARKRRIPIVGSNHFIPENLAPYIPILPRLKPVFNWILWQWMIDVYKYAQVVIAQSNASASLISKQGFKMPILTISCGIDLKRLYPNPNEDRVKYCSRYGLDPQKKIFLFLGRIDGEKRIDLLLQAMNQIKRDDIQLAIAGHGKVEQRLRQLSATMNLSPRVKFTGFIPAEDVPGLMNSVDVFIMPSEAELLSISTLEAMACGRPVLLADALALPELVREGENGYLFKARDVSDLIRTMNLLADQPDCWGKMGLVSREISLPHSLDEMLHRYEVLYSQLAMAGSVVQVEKGERIPA